MVMLELNSLRANRRIGTAPVPSRRKNTARALYMYNDGESPPLLLANKLTDLNLEDSNETQSVMSLQPCNDTEVFKETKPELNMFEGVDHAKSKKKERNTRLSSKPFIRKSTRASKRVKETASTQNNSSPKQQAAILNKVISDTIQIDSEKDTLGVVVDDLLELPYSAPMIPESPPSLFKSSFRQVYHTC